MYISDVNPYFETLEQNYARFLDDEGVEERIRVFPHNVGDVLGLLKQSGFSEVQISEFRISGEVAAVSVELERLRGFPLIIEYYAVKP